MTWEFRLLPGKFRLSLLHVFAYVSCFSGAFMFFFGCFVLFSYVSCFIFPHVALLCFNVLNVAFICFMFFHMFQVFHVAFMCFMFSCVLIKLRDIMFIFAIFHLDWPAKRPPQVRFDLPEMQVLKAESRTCGGHFSQANPSGQLAN